MKLIAAIKVQVGCEVDSELKDLPIEKKKRLADLIEERVPSGLATIDEWNEVISCFTDTAHTSDNKRAKKKLLDILRGE